MHKEDFVFYNNKKYLLKIYVQRRRSTYMSISKNVIIRVPSFLSLKRQEEQIEKMKEKFIYYLKKDQEKFAPLTYKKYQTGDVLKLINKEYFIDIKYKDKKTSSAKLENNIIYLALSNNLKDETRTISILLNKIICKDQDIYIKTKINFLNKKYFNRQLGKISLKNNHSKFGSCSSKNDITISTSLLVSREDVLDYVIIHELAHTIEHNHSKRFWKLVKEIVPDYKEKIKYLRDNRNKLII